MKKEKISNTRKKILEIYEQNELANLEVNKSRARSVTVGTAFGGATEISMRGDYSNLWAIMQPVEVVELIEQLASGIGLQIAMRPRQDFAAWRGWNTDLEHRYWAGQDQWQIEQGILNYKKTLVEVQEEQKKLLEGIPEEKIEPKKVQKRLRKNKRVKELNDLQKKVADDLCKPALENIDQLRKDVAKDHNECLEKLNPSDIQL